MEPILKSTSPETIENKFTFLFLAIRGSDRKALREIQQRFSLTLQSGSPAMESHRYPLVSTADMPTCTPRVQP